MNPAQPQPFGELDAPTDVNKLMALMKEYTATLRATCEHEVNRRYRFMIFNLTMFSICVFLVGGSAVVLRYVSTSTYTLIGGTGLIMLVSLAWLLYGREGFGHGRYSEDADELAATVGRLIEISYQYRQHASKRVADKFEFDLRLTEADAVMRTYKSLFKPRAKN